MSPFLVVPLHRFAPLLARLDPVDDRRDLDLCERTREAVVERERVRHSHLARLGVLGQDPVLSARERLKRPRQVGGRDERPGGNVLWFERGRKRVSPKRTPAEDERVD